MPVKMFGVTLWVVLLAASVSGVIGRWNDNDRTQSCDKEIKEMLHILTNEVAELKKEVQEMNRSRNSESEEQEAKKNEKKNTDGELKILSVNRKALVGREGQYTVRYQDPDNISSLPSKVVWNDYRDYMYTDIPETVSNQIPNLPPGVFETSTTTTAQNDSYVVVSIGHGDKRWLRLYLTNDNVTDMTETDIETPLLGIVPNGDIVYEPGHNATATILHPPEKNRDGSESGHIDDYNFYFNFFVTKPGFRDVITRYGRGDNFDNNIVHLDNERKFVDKIELNMVIQTDETSYSGLFVIASGDSKETGLVRRIENSKINVLRPSTQKEAFLEGNIYVSNDLTLERNENGDFKMFCAYGETCKTYCHFFGNDLSNLELFKTLNGNTTREYIDVNHLGLVSLSVSRYGLIEVSPIYPDPSPVVYTCRASNDEGQTLDTKTVVTFGYDVNILVNESSMEMLDDTTAKLVCTVRGQPIANVTIQCGDTEAEDSEIVYQSHNETRVTATCPYNQEYTSATLSCTAHNGFQIDYHRFWEEYYSYSVVID